MKILEGPWGKKKPETEIEINTWVLDSSPEVIDKASKDFATRLRENGWDVDEVQELWYGFHEALTNVIALIKEELEKHPGKKDKKVQIVIEIRKKKVRVEIGDEVSSLNSEDVPDPAPPKGIGLSMESFFDPVDFFKIVDENGKVVGHKVILIKEKKEQIIN
jgi:anti-sigma regulatory factor (Ser/Thr protein kinase)